MSYITGNDVVEYRKRRNLSRKALAVESGLTEGKIWRIENKGTISDEEERALHLVGVTPLGQDQAVADPPTLAETPISLRTVAPVDRALGDTRRVEDVDVDFGALLETASGPTYDWYVSNSELQTFKACRRKWWLAWYRGLRPIRESPVGVRQIGDRLHRALKEHYVPGGPRVPDHLLDALERLIVFDRSTVGVMSDDESARFDKEADLQRIMLEGYLAWLAETGADSELEVIYPETYLEAGLDEFEGKVALIGKIDVRVRRTTDQAHLFIDHKSVGDLRSPTLMLPLDEQMLHYHLLETLGLPDDEHCDGALYNMLRRVKRTGTAKPPFYSRVEVKHNPHELKSFRRRVVGEIEDILDVRDALDHATDHRTVAYPRPSRDCTWACDFFSICSMFDDGSRVEDMITQYFRKGDPLEYYQTEVLGGLE